MTNSEYKELLLDKADNYLKGPGISVSLDEFTFQHPGVVFGPGPGTPRGYYRGDETHEFDHLYVIDELISSRIHWKNTDRVNVDYYDIHDLGLTWYKFYFYFDRYDIHREKNTLLYHEAIAVARAKKLYRPLPPILYKRA
jgi:hypothetical protein